MQEGIEDMENRDNKRKKELTTERKRDILQLGYNRGGL